METAPERDVCEIEIVLADEPPEVIGGQRVIDSWPAEVKKALEARNMSATPCCQHENCVIMMKVPSKSLTAVEFTPDEIDLGALWLLDALEAEFSSWEPWLDAVLDAEGEPCEATDWEV